MATDPIFVARRADTGTLVSAGDINPDGPRPQFHCDGCMRQGHHVHLDFVRAATRRTEFRNLRDPTVDTFTKEFSFPAHFRRHIEAKEHQCDHPARYAALRGLAMRMNAREVGTGSFVFSFAPPQEMILPERSTPWVDFRSAVRPAGFKDLGGITRAADMEKLYALLKDDPALIPSQHIHDGYVVRPLSESYFDGSLRLRDYLRASKGIGFNNAKMVLAAFDPNTHTEALNDWRDKKMYLDWSMPVMPGRTERSKFFLSAAFRNEAWSALDKMALRRGHMRKAPLLALGFAYLRPEDGDTIEILIDSPDQIVPWENKGTLFPAPPLAKPSGAQHVLVL